MSLFGAIDQGTSSSRFCIFNTDGKIVAYHQMETSSIYPKEGWVEQDPLMILESVAICIEKACEKLENLEGGFTVSNIKAIGVTNQRESMLLWDTTTGKPLHNAIIWLDTRTSGTVHNLIKKANDNKFHFQKKCGLPIATYFSAVKYRWILDNITPEIQAALDKETLRFGTIDTWLIWNLTGGVNGGVFITDVTNASRTMLMNLVTLNWDDELCNFFEISKKTLPEIRSSAEIYGHVKTGILANIPISGCAGDQQAALVGHRCFKIGQVKNTYGTGCFMLFNTGTIPVISKHGLLTTLAYKIGNNKPIYALEGSVAIAGAGINWLRDNLKIISKSSEVGELASQVSDTGGVYFVPAFSGLFAPYWRDDARGVIVGLTQKTDTRHLCRAILEAICFQTKEVLSSMNKDSGNNLTLLKVDGGVTNSAVCMQIQADLLDIQIENPEMKESTALGAVILAGLGIGHWKSESDVHLHDNFQVYQSTISKHERDLRYASWKRAVNRSVNLSEDPDLTVLHKDQQLDAPTSKSSHHHSSLTALKNPITPPHIDSTMAVEWIPTISGIAVFTAFAYLIIRKMA